MKVSGVSEMGIEKEKNVGVASLNLNTSYYIYIVHENLKHKHAALL